MHLVITVLYLVWGLAFGFIFNALFQSSLLDGLIAIILYGVSLVFGAGIGYGYKAYIWHKKGWKKMKLPTSVKIANGFLTLGSLLYGLSILIFYLPSNPISQLSFILIFFWLFTSIISETLTEVANYKYFPTEINKAA